MRNPKRVISIIRVKNVAIDQSTLYSPPSRMQGPKGYKAQNKNWFIEILRRKCYTEFCMPYKQPGTPTRLSWRAS
jgi:hypothetical protein